MSAHSPTLTEASKVVVDNSDPDEVRRYLVQPHMRKAWEAAFEARLRRAERDAVRLYAEIMKWVGAQPTFMLNAWTLLQVSGEDEARSLISRARRVENIDEDETFALSREWMEGYLARQGKRLVILGGDASESPALTDGGTNGVGIGGNGHP